MAKRVAQLRGRLADALSALVLWCACLISGCATTSAALTAKGNWYEVASPRFLVFTDGDPEQARALVADLERFHSVLLATTTAEAHDGAPPLRIFLAKSESSFNAWAPPHDRPGLLGLFLATSRGNYGIANGETLRESDSEPGSRIVLFHEYTHYMMAAKGARVPSWYNEGFAEYMSTTRFREDGSYTLGCPARFRTGHTSWMRWLPMAKLLQAEDIQDLMLEGTGGIRTGKAPTDSYAESWYAVHLLSSDPSLHRQLDEYLKLWANGVAPEAALRQALGLSYAQFDNLVQQYAARPALNCLAVRPARPLNAPAVRVRAMPQSDVYYRLGDLSLSVLGPTDETFELFRKALVSNYRDVRALAASARAHFMKARIAKEAAQQEEMVSGKKLLDRAAAIAPNDAEVLALDAYLHHARAAYLQQHQGDWAAELGAARTAYRKAIRRDETIAEAYAGLGLTYLIEDAGTSQEPQVVLEAAAFLLPLETSIALTLGEIHARRNHPVEAIPALEYTLRWSKRPKERDAASKLLAEIKARLAASPLPGTDASAPDGAPAGTAGNNRDGPR
jgi:tetratricopeptide (TPR) repeat protein